MPDFEIERQVLKRDKLWHKRRGMRWGMLKLKLRFILVIEAGIDILLKEGPIVLMSKFIEKVKSYKS